MTDDTRAEAGATPSGPQPIFPFRPPHASTTPPSGDPYATWTWFGWVTSTAQGTTASAATSTVAAAGHGGRTALHAIVGPTVRARAPGVTAAWSTVQEQDCGKELYMIKRRGIVFHVYERCIKYTDSGGREVVLPKLELAGDRPKGQDVGVFLLPDTKSTIYFSKARQALMGGATMVLVAPGCKPLRLIQLTRTYKKRWLDGDPEPKDFELTEPLLGKKGQDLIAAPVDDGTKWAIDYTADGGGEPPDYQQLITAQDNVTVVGMKDDPATQLGKDASGKGYRILRRYDFITLIYCGGTLLGSVRWGFNISGHVTADGSVDEFTSEVEKGEPLFAAPDSSQSKDAETIAKGLEGKLKEALKQLKK